MRVCVIAAMESERRSLEAIGVRCVESGIGKVNAAAATAECILKYQPDCIVNTGCAGSMHPSVRQGDVVIASRTAYHDVWCGEGNVPGQVEGQPLFFDADPVLLQAARSISGGAGTHEGLIVTGDQFYISDAEDRRILSVHPDALASDMESAAIAQVCRRFAVPFLSIRVISDVHETAEDQKESYESFWKEMADKSFDFASHLVKVLEKL